MVKEKTNVTSLLFKLDMFINKKEKIYKNKNKGKGNRTLIKVNLTFVLTSLNYTLIK